MSRKHSTEYVPAGRIFHTGSRRKLLSIATAVFEIQIFLFGNAGHLRRHDRTAVMTLMRQQAGILSDMPGKGAFDTRRQDARLSRNVINVIHFTRRPRGLPGPWLFHLVTPVNLTTDMSKFGAD